MIPQHIFIQLLSFLNCWRVLTSPSSLRNRPTSMLNIVIKLLVFNAIREYRILRTLLTCLRCLIWLLVQIYIFKTKLNCKTENKYKRVKTLSHFFICKIIKTSPLWIMLYARYNEAQKYISKLVLANQHLR